MRNKNILLVLCGFIPLAIGFTMNWLMMNFQYTALTFGLIPIAFLVVWAWLGAISYKFQENIKVSFCLIHLPMFLSLVLNLYQEIVLGRYFGNIIGICTQFFFLPVLRISFGLNSWSTNMWTAYIIGFILVCLVFYGGYRLRRSQKL